MEVKFTTDDPYEKRLFELFKNHQQGKDKTGLDHGGLVKLCMSLELRDRGEALVKLLTAKSVSNEASDKWLVSFQDFRAGLLQILGEELKSNENNEGQAMSQTSDSVSDNNKKLSSKEKLVKSDALSDAETSDREIKPKFVVGRKKYGRRSRPLDTLKAAGKDSTLSESDDEDDELSFYESPNDLRNQSSSGDASSGSNKTGNKVKRSVSQSEMQESKRRRPISANRLKRCASLPPQNRNIHGKNRFVKDRTGNQTNEIDVENLSINLQEIWTSLSTDPNRDELKITLDQLESVCEKLGLHSIGAKQAALEAFDKLAIPLSGTISYQQFVDLVQNDSNVLSSRENSMDTVAVIDDNATITQESPKSSDEDRYCLSSITREAGSVDSDIIIEMWESAGVVSASALLVGLGFYGNRIQISELITTLEEEIQRTANEKEILPLLKASLTLHKAEVGALRHAFKQIIDENKKLYSNNKEMNKRAAILAQEVDERHISIEKMTKKEIQTLESRHSETFKQLSDQLTSERDQYTAINVRLENRIKNLESEENKLKAELSSLLEENGALDSEKCDLQNQITDLYEQNIKLNQEIAELEDLKATELKKEKENEEILELMDKVSSLQIENSNLRDKNDELTTEVEGLNIELNRYKTLRKSMNRPHENTSEASQEEISGTIDQEMNGTGAIKRRGDSPSKTRLSEESPRQGKLRKCHNGDPGGNESETSGEWMALNSELNQSSMPSHQGTTTTSGFSQDTDDTSMSDTDTVKLLKQKINELQGKLEGIPKDRNEWMKETDALKQRCQDLEASLEQMRKEYEDCEDYWQNKLAEERILYEEEQRQSDDKFTELLSKMSEYEEQFASATEKDGKLSPIAENSMLEQQYTALETEMDELIQKARASLDERDKEIDELKAKLKQTRTKDYSPPTPPRVDTPDSPASSTISYLFWNQSSIHGPARDYQNPVHKPAQNNVQEGISFKEEEEANMRKSISPIQKPVKITDECDGRSTKSVATTHSVHHSTRSPSPVDYNDIQLRERNLKEEVQMLAYQRDSLISELQQLQEAKPILAQAYTNIPHPNLSNRVQYLEQKNKHLQNVLKQQQQYMETVMHQAWQQQRLEIVELRNRLEAQSVVITEQAQRLANADLLAKDLFVENSHLTAAIQRLEQQRTRQALLQLSQHLPHLNQQGLGHLP